MNKLQVVVAATVIGVMCIVGACSNGTAGTAASVGVPVVEATAATSAPATVTVKATQTVKVTAKAPAPKTVTVTKTETVTEVPQSCLDAISGAREIMMSFVKVMKASGEVMGGIEGFMNAILTQDTAGVQEFTSILQSTTNTVQEADAELNNSSFADDSTACEAAAN